MSENTEVKTEEKKKNHSDSDIAKLVKASEKMQTDNESLQTKITELETASKDRAEKDKVAKDKIKVDNQKFEELANDRQKELAELTAKHKDVSDKYDALSQEAENDRLRVLTEIVEEFSLSEDEKKDIEGLGKKALTVFSKMKKGAEKKGSDKSESPKDDSDKININDLYGYDRLNKESDKQKHGMADTYMKAMNKQ